MDIAKKEGLLCRYQDSAELRSLMVAFAGYERNMNVILLRTIVDRWPDDGSTPSAKAAAALSGFRALDALGIGRLILGRRGAETRTVSRRKRRRRTTMSPGRRRGRAMT